MYSVIITSFFFLFFFFNVKERNLFKKFAKRRLLHFLLSALSKGMPRSNSCEKCTINDQFTAGNKCPDTSFLQSEIIQRRLNQGFIFQNVAPQYAAQAMRSEVARVNGTLDADLGAVLAGNAIYIKHFLCNSDDRSYYDSLKKELLYSTGASISSEGGLIEWSKHQAFENPSTLSPTFNKIIDMLSDYFELDVYATRLNYYRDGSQWKPQHHDSHAYGDRAEREDFTAGITLGSSRSLLFVHVESRQEFTFPQNNGDCFAFSSEVNQSFTHGVPRATKIYVGDRFSIIAWGRRRSINERNGRGIQSLSLTKLEGAKLATVEDAVRAAQVLVSSTATFEPRTKECSEKKLQKKKKNRLQ